MSDLDPLTAYEDDTTTDKVHHPYTAYNQGCDAGEQGLGIDKNPYTGHRLRTWWNDGYRNGSTKEAADEHRR